VNNQTWIVTSVLGAGNSRNLARISSLKHIHPTPIGSCAALLGNHVTGNTHASPKKDIIPPHITVGKLFCHLLTQIETGLLVHIQKNGHTWTLSFK